MELPTCRVSAVGPMRQEPRLRPPNPRLPPHRPIIDTSTFRPRATSPLTDAARPPSPPPPSTLQMSSQERINHLIDAGTWRPLDETLSPVDPLEFTDLKPYTDRIKEAQEKTGLQVGAAAGCGRTLWYSAWPRLSGILRSLCRHLVLQSCATYSDHHVLHQTHAPAIPVPHLPPPHRTQPHTQPTPRTACARARACCTASPWRWASWTSPTWAAPWAAWWARSSPASSSTPRRCGLGVWGAG